MAKRFTDTEKWNRKWFRALSPKMKCAWNYLCDRCDHAGVWEPDFDLMSLFIGAEVTAEEFEKSFSGRVLKLPQSERYLLLGFVSFQYIALKKGNRTHESVMNILRAFAPNICPESLALYPKPYITLDKPLASPSLTPSEISEGLSGILEGCKDTDTDKDKGKYKESEPFGFKKATFSIGDIA